MKTYRVTLMVDEKWLAFLDEAYSHVYDNEIFMFEHVSEPFESTPPMSEEQFLAIIGGHE